MLTIVQMCVSVYANSTLQYWRCEHSFTYCCKQVYFGGGGGSVLSDGLRALRNLKLHTCTGWVPLGAVPPQLRLLRIAECDELAFHAGFLAGLRSQRSARCELLQAWQVCLHMLGLPGSWGSCWGCLAEDTTVKPDYPLHLVSWHAMAQAVCLLARVPAPTAAVARELRQRRRQTIHKRHHLLVAALPCPM